MNNQTNWLETAKEMAEKQSVFLAEDQNGKTIVFECELINAQTERLTQKIRELSDLFVASYTAQELSFARQYPEAVATEYFLKSLEPLCKDGPEKVDWLLIEEKIKAIFQQFFITTDFGKASKAGELYLFVTAKDQAMGELLGAIQFLIAPEFEYGIVKAAMFGVTAQAKERGVEKILMSTIFKLVPETTRIFLHTRTTNKGVIDQYKNWGFTQFPGQLTHWIDLEYLAEKSETLQKTAQQLIQK